MCGDANNNWALTERSKKMRRGRNIALVLLVALTTFAAGFSPASAQEEAAPIINTGGQPSPPISSSAQQVGWLKRDTLTGDWGGARPWLNEHGITFKPRLTQFYQGMTSGDGKHDFQYGAKADVLLNSNLSKLGTWKGLSLTVHTEYNFGNSVNALGGTLVPVNTALQFPGIKGGDAFDVTSVYFTQTFGTSVSLLLGKIDMIDLYSSKIFMGGAGIDAFWNTYFAAPPSGTVPPSLLGAALTVRTKPATFGLWIYDPRNAQNRSGFEHLFADGVTFRGSVTFPVSIAGRSGHQGFVGLYSTQNGTDLNSLEDILFPPYPPITLKEHRHYFSYSFDQYLYQSKNKPKEGVGLFGQIGISDGNPNKLYWSALVGVGSTGLIPGRSRDNWGVGYYYAVPSPLLKSSLASVIRIQNEQGTEVFYNFALTPWLALGADLQIIQPGLKNDTAVFPGLRTVIRF
jgi:porin